MKDNRQNFQAASTLTHLAIVEDRKKFQKMEPKDINATRAWSGTTLSIFAIRVEKIIYSFDQHISIDNNKSKQNKWNSLIQYLVAYFKQHLDQKFSIVSLYINGPYC